MLNSKHIHFVYDSSSRLQASPASAVDPQDFKSNAVFNGIKGILEQVGVLVGKVWPKDVFTLTGKMLKKDRIVFSLEMERALGIVLPSLVLILCYTFKSLISNVY